MYVDADPDDTCKRACGLLDGRPRLVRSDFVLAPGSRQRRPGTSLVNDSQTYENMPAPYYSRLRYSDPAREAKTRTMVIYFETVVESRLYHYSSKP